MERKVLFQRKKFLDATPSSKVHGVADVSVSEVSLTAAEQLKPKEK